MTEEKGYIDVQEEGGVIRISYEAIGEIAAEAAMAVAGVAGMAALPQSAVKGVCVSLSEIGICSIDVHIFAAVGYPITQIGKTVQSEVKTAVDAAVGIEVAAVNVFVAGVVMKK